MAASHDDDHLPSRWRAVGHRDRLATCRKPIPPQDFAGRYIISTDVIIERGCEESNAARGDDRTAERWHAHLERKRNWRFVADRTVLVLPDDLASPEIDAGDIAPGGRLARIFDRRQERV